MNRTLNAQENTRVPLSGRLDEFRIALEEEIKSAKRDAFTQAISLVSGRRIAQAGNSFQYAFRLENALNLPGDAPADLHIPNYRTVEITIVAVEGLSLIISSPIDLGDYVPRARLVSDLTFLMRRLIERIEDLSEEQNSVGENILKNSSEGNYHQLMISTDLNKKQQEALQSSLGRNLTFIWGPPGTGKTKTIGSIGYQLASENRSLILTSHTNTAVDQALLRIAELAPAQDIDNGKILRIGEPRDEKLYDYPNLLLDTHVKRRSDELSTRLISLESELAEKRDYIVKLTNEIDLYDWFKSSENDFHEMSHKNVQLNELRINLKNTSRDLDELRNLSSYWNKAKEAATVTNKKIKQVKKINSKLSVLKNKFDEAITNQEKLQKQLSEAKELLGQTQSVNWIIRRWRRLPSPEHQKELVYEYQVKETILNKEINNLSNEIAQDENIRDKLLNDCYKFASKYSVEPNELLRQESIFRRNLGQTQSDVKELSRIHKTLRSDTIQLFSSRIEILHDLGYVDSEQVSTEDMFACIEEAFRKIKVVVDQTDINHSRKMLKTAIEQVGALIIEKKTIEENLSRLEEVIISEASIIATTLTRTYLNDSIRSRKFDTIIVDEASMASIPAIWVAAGLVEKNAIIVGDPKQLPPIVISSHELAKKWLGTDIFKTSGVMETESDNLIMLNEQYRMHPKITSIPNYFFYEGALRNSQLVETKGEMGKWYNSTWEYDSPVVLIDTGPLNAWVTSVPRGKGSSRLNFLSAILCTDLCQILLKNNQYNSHPSEPKRIFIECPYSPHARLLGILIQENNLEGNVNAGTIHTFQGSEAEVVILDLVNDEPHWRVGLFMPTNDETTKRLFNVGVSRARSRLIIVGDFSYIEKLSKNSFLGREFIPFLKKNFPLYSALDIVPLGILDRAAKASTLLSRGRVESDSTQIIVTQDDFYTLLQEDIVHAKNKIVVYSPFMTKDRLAELHVAFRSAIDRGVRLFVITKTIQERGKRQKSSYHALEHALKKWGATIIHKRRMHEKIVIIDDEIIWSGSLNPLSFSNTQEIMERRKSNTIVKEYSRVIRLDELIQEYQSGSPRCPICKAEMVASEGRDDPYFWRCVEDGCYSRSIDQPKISGGRITCSNCGGEVEFGEWGGKPVWRCVENRRHRQGIVKNHLRLPEMRKKIPEDRLFELDKRFGLSTSEQIGPPQS